MATIPVQVAIRCRPLTTMETDEGAEFALSFTPGEPQIVVNDAHKAFTFNYVFTPEISQENIYSCCVRPLVENIFHGYNATVLAYGQTGSGKTYTMGTAGTVDGIIQRAVSDIFTYISTNGDRVIKVKASLLEIYNEDIFDLFADSRNKDAVTIREDFNGVKVCGMSELQVSSQDEVLKLLEKGTANRRTGSTNMNICSSRSHAIFTLTIEQDSDTMTTAKFHLVDLAGSERVKKTGAQGERLREGININRGLLSLGNVICALCENRAHIPYRDSKLTRLLQESLGGNSHTIMIACVSPADLNFEETLNTLRYADRARKIQNKPVINIDPMYQDIECLRQTISEMEDRWCSHMKHCPLSSAQISSKDSVFKSTSKDETDEGRKCSEPDDRNLVDPEPVLERNETLSNSSGCEEGELDEESLTMQLAVISEELERKETHLSIMSRGHDDMEKVRTEYEAQIQDLTQEIDHLRVEKNQLYAVARAPNVASKVSEERRKKIQQLEQKIAEITKELQKKQRMLREKEEVEKKSKTLQNEIINLKRSKVRLMKQAQKDAQLFNELQRKLKRGEMRADTLELRHRRQLQKSNNEKAVLQRKVAEAQSIKRKLEQALNKKQMARGKVHNRTVSAKGVQQFLMNELDIEVHRAEARHHLEQLKEDRGTLARKLRLLEEEADDKPSPAKVSRDSFSEKTKEDEQIELQKDLDKRSQQISDLHEKIFIADSDPKERFSSIVRLDEARLFLDQLFDVTVSKSIQITELERKVMEFEACKTRLERELDTAESIHKQSLDQQRMANDEKILYLMQEVVGSSSQLGSEPVRYSDFKDQEISRLGYLSEELQRKNDEFSKLQREVEALRSSKPVKNQTATKKAVRVNYQSISDTEEDEDDSQNTSLKDPDWVKTPMQKRHSKRRMTRNIAEIKSEDIESEDSCSSSKSYKRNSSMASCKCRGRCHSKICGCQKHGRSCTSSCQCLLEMCENRAGKENSGAAGDSATTLNTTFQIPNSRILKVQNEDQSSEAEFGLFKRRTIYRPANGSFFGDSS